MEDGARDDEVDEEGGVSKAEQRKLKSATHYHVAKICEEEGTLSPLSHLTKDSHPEHRTALGDEREPASGSRHQ
jgi:hypothetical protein